jgi:membrane protease YdiL (CAAX protease family)
MATPVDAEQRVKRASPAVWAALAATAVLLVYGNAVSAFPHETRDQFLLWSNLALMAVLVALALGRARLSPDELGLGLGTARGSAYVGAALGLVAAVPPVAFVGLAPLFSGDAVESPGITEKSGAGMAYFLLFRQPVGTALFEEVSFRGVLYGLWSRVGGDRAALLATAAAFSAWHLVITSRTVAESGVVDNPAAVAAGVIVSLTGLFVGGLLLAYLRWHTRSIAAAVVAHWLIVAFMTVAVWGMA